MEKFSNKEMKKIAYEIISQELKDYSNNEDVYIFPVTTLEYYTQFIARFIKVCNTKKIHYSINALIQLIERPFKTSGCHIEMRTNKNLIISIIIFINNLKKINPFFINFLATCYHELRHSIQLTFDDYCYPNFLRLIEDLLIAYNFTNYNNNHDNYSTEIGANLYAIIKTEEFLKNKYPDIYELEAQNIKNCENDYKQDYILFDAVNQMNKALEVVNKENLKINDKIPIFNIFVRDDNSFKSIEDMIKNPEFQKLDKRIIYTILSSNSFLKNIDIQQLSLDELTTLDEALQYTYTIYHNQYRFILNKLNNKEINFKFFIETAERLIKNIKEINKHITLLNSAKDKKQYQYKLNK